jgi:hypothetical protein
MAAIMIVFAAFDVKQVRLFGVSQISTRNVYRH